MRKSYGAEIMLCPPCVQKREDCFANKGGRCDILNNTRFGKRVCPFYKPLDVWIYEGIEKKEQGFDEEYEG